MGGSRKILELAGDYPVRLAYARLNLKLSILLKRQPDPIHHDFLGLQVHAGTSPL
jgi:hypothetical protein